MRKLTFDEVLQEYSRGRRDFTNVNVVMNRDIDREEFIQINLSGADFRGGNLRFFWAYLGGRKGAGINLSGANFNGLELTYQHFIGANLRGTAFQNAGLLGADFSFADLTGADLSGTDLEGTNFYKANLTGTSFRNVKIAHNSFIVSNLTDADFRTNIPMKDVSFYECNLTRTNFIGIKGLKCGVGGINPKNTFFETVMPDGSIRN